MIRVFVGNHIAENCIHVELVDTLVKNYNIMAALNWDPGCP